MAVKYVLVSLPLTKDEMGEFASLRPGWGFVFCKPGEVQPVQVRAADIIIGHVEPWMLSDASHLEWLQLSSSGADAYLAPGVLPERVTLTTSTGAYGQAVSEHMLAMVLSSLKKLHLYRDDQHACLWRDEGEVSTLDGAHVLVLGAGDIGTHFARLCHALGSQVRGIRRHPAAVAPEPFEEVGTMDDLDDLLPWADVVLCALPSTAETRHLADERFFSRMKPGALFANCGRGDLVSNSDLALALMSGQLGCACLDVCDPEPLPADSALWELRSCVITPHVSGYNHLPLTRRRVVDVCLDNLRRYVAGEPLRNVRRSRHERLDGAGADGAGAPAAELEG